MKVSFPNALPLARKVLRALVVLNALYAAGIVVLLILSLVSADLLAVGLGIKPSPDGGTLIPGMQLIMVLGVASAGVAHLTLRRLQAIVETVRSGDPFVSENAARLQTIAWAVLGLELFHIAIGLTAAAVSTDAQPLDINWSFSFTPWIAVLLLFVLARVFDHGARMRADLEGTV
jgi:hypothetical protein